NVMPRCQKSTTYSTIGPSCSRRAMVQRGLRSSIRSRPHRVSPTASRANAARLSRCNKAAITAARFASSPTLGEPADRFRWGLLPHLHLSLQAGDDLILKRMKRRHSRTEAIAVAQRARELRPEIALGADLIAGFPTETEAMFGRTLELIGECGLAFVHVFPYSVRTGTPAARMP